MRILWIVVIIVSLFLTACNREGLAGLGEIGNAIRDDDADLWFTSETNQQVDLFIRGVVLVNGGILPPPKLKLVVDDVILADDSTELNPNAPASTRCIGTWLFDEPDRRQSLTSTIKVFTSGSSEGAQTATLNWTNQNVTRTLNINGFLVTVATRVTRFADPTPQENGDSDEDGILDREEAMIAKPNLRTGCPHRRDALLVVGYTHPDWRMTVKSKELLSTVFARHDINLEVITDAGEMGLVTPGQVQIDGGSAARGAVVAVTDVPPLRPAHIPPQYEPFAHFLVLVETVGVCGGRPAGGYGCADLPGLNLVAKSHLPVLGPDIWEYQAKDVMHEFGHNLGLCHPTESTTDCPTGPIPVSERDPGSSVMGTPAENPGQPVELMTNALKRPMDYSPTQWTNLDLTLSRTP